MKLRKTAQTSFALAAASLLAVGCAMERSDRGYTRLQPAPLYEDDRFITSAHGDVTGGNYGGFGSRAQFGTGQAEEFRQGRGAPADQYWQERGVGRSGIDRSRGDWQEMDRQQQRQQQELRGPDSSQLDQQIIIPLHEEQLRVGTREVDAGQITLRKVIRTETVEQPVQVRRETLVLDHQPAHQANQGQSFQAGQDQQFQQQGQQSQQQAQPFQEREIVIQLRNQEPVVETYIVPSGRIIARKQVQSDQQMVQRQLRHEELDLNQAQGQNVVITENLRREMSEGVGAPPSSREQLRGSGQQLDSRQHQQHDQLQQRDQFQQQQEAGKPPFPAEQTRGLGAGGQPITEVSELTTSLTDLAGRPVQLNQVQVQEVYDGWVSLGAEGQPSVLVKTQDAAALSALQKGDTVKLAGTVKAVPTQLTEFPQQAQQALQGKRIYVEATNLEKIAK